MTKKNNKRKLEEVEAEEDLIKEVKRQPIDCEAVGIGPDGTESALARVTIVNFHGVVVLDKYVKPLDYVTNFRTEISGITRKMLINANKFKDVQKEVSDIIKDRIIIGHAIHNDLKLLLLDHPSSMIRDTSKYKPFRKHSNGSSMLENQFTTKRIRLDSKEKKEQQNGSSSKFPIPYETNDDSVETDEKLIPINYNSAKHGKDFVFPSHSDFLDNPGYSRQYINNSNTKTPIKKLVIKPLKVKPSLPSDFEEKTWAKLASAIQAIYSSKSVNDSLEELYKACENLCLHKLSKSLYQKLHSELEKHILLEGEQIQKDLGLELFRKHIMIASNIRAKTLSGILSLIKQERDGDAVDYALIKSLIRMFIDLNIYYHGFEIPFLEETRSYFMIEGQRLVSEFSVPQYLSHVSNRLSIESARAAEYLDKKTMDPLLKAIDEELIMKHKTGTQIVTDTNNESDMVSELLTLKSRMDSIVNGPFQTKYVDQKLRQGNKSMNDTEMEHMLNEVLVLFRYIQGKDIFEAFYKRDLAKRLLLNKSASFDYEKSMLTKLRKECGPGFTGKLEGMFKDIDLSRDFMRSFQDSKASEEMKRYKIDFSVNILTQGFWPTYAPNPCNLPPYMTQCQEIFKDFYLSKHSGRNLKWQNSLGHCILSANFPLVCCKLVVSLYQAVTLLLFNSYEDISQRVTYEEIKEITGLDHKDLTLTLQSLACGKTRVLTKFPKGRDVNKTDKFAINEKFDVQYYRVKINSIQLKETLEENNDTTERVFLDRQYQVDAALVRIMKMRKSLTHNEIVTELLGQLKFKAMVSDIKKRIESLIDRDYLERDPDDSSVIRYLA
nr:12084_t:CDS:10 [Entrophospora candida]